MRHLPAVRRLLAAALAVLALSAWGPAARAQEGELRILQQDLKTLGLYAGPVDGEHSEALAAAIAAYVRQAGFREPAERAFRHIGALTRDVDLEVRIRKGKARVAERQTLPTRFGDMEIATYRQEGAPAGFADGRRVSIAGRRVDAGLAGFARCCEGRVLAIGEADVVVLQGVLDAPGCEFGRVYVSLTRERFSVTDEEDSCAASPVFAVENGRLTVTAQSRTSLLDARWTLVPGEAMAFERLIVGGSLETLAWWVGRQPFERIDRGFRFFYFTPLADALGALLEPEALGWALKMTFTTPVERRGDVLFVSGSYKPDETLVSVTVDMAGRAVHACSFNRGTTRFASTLLRGVFSDPAASCPADIERALAAWTAMGVASGGAPARVFGFEGVFGGEAQCKAGGDQVTRITARSLKTPGEPECAITEVGIADGDYVVATTCRTVPIKRLDDDRIDLDGEVMRRCSP